ncbi:hypothetical protein TNCV_3220851 [Trichonephila clavipes]|nr:hypothetical protein TNCV_3220851 [Trichonephila clavipes]
MKLVMCVKKLSILCEANKFRSDDVQKLLDIHNQELTMDELIEMHEQEQDIEELESLDPVQSENRMTVVNLTEGLNLIENGS